MLTDQASDAAAFAFIERLVATPSVSKQEADAASVFAAEAESLGFAVEIDAVHNAIATRPASGERLIQIMLLGHIDTVPGDIPVRVERGVLHGRGSVDAKGPLAAMLYGAARANLPLGVELIVAAAVGEEAAESIGAKTLVPRFNPNACIIGEPSGWDGVTLGYKGRLVVRATCSQSLSHSAGPGGGSRDTLFAWWTSVIRWCEDQSQHAKGAFDAIQATVQNWRPADDWQTDAAEMTCGFRLPPGVTPEAVHDQLKLLAEDAIATERIGEEIAHVTTRQDPVVRSISAAIRSLEGSPKPKRKTGTADLNVVAPIWKCPIAAYGPGDSSLDHTPVEHLHLEEFSKSISVIRHALESLARDLLEQQAE